MSKYVLKTPEPITGEEADCLAAVLSESFKEAGAVFLPAGFVIERVEDEAEASRE